MKRDLRDPLQFGMAYLQARKGKVPIDVAVQLNTPRYRSDESCVEKYGRPEDLEPKWMEVQVK